MPADPKVVKLYSDFIKQIEGFTQQQAERIERRVKQKLPVGEQPDNEMRFREGEVLFLGMIKKMAARKRIAVRAHSKA